jgi:hypothetical protein
MSDSPRDPLGALVGGSALTMQDQVVGTRPGPSGQQVVAITVLRGFRPASIRAVAGLPLRIVFRREDDDACSERVVFSAPRLDRRLAARGATTVDLPAQPPGEIRFTCGMGRYRGRIELVVETRPSSRERLRERVARLKAPLGRALVLWICSLPLIVVLAALAFDVEAAILGAAAALVVLVTGCLWGFRPSVRPT